MSAASRHLRPIVLVLAACLGAVASCKPEEPPAPPPPPPKEPAPPTLAEAADQIIAAYFQTHPVSATALGDHTHDGAWPDLTPDGIAADRTRIDEARALLDKVELGPVSPDDVVDISILRNELSLQAFGHEIERPWVRDPFWYASLLGGGLDDLVSRDFAPIEERAASLATRLETLPTLCEQAIANIDPADAMLPQTQVAIQQLGGVVDLIRATVPRRTGAAPDDLKSRIGVATGPAIAAIRALQQHLRTQVLPKAAGAWRLGAENYERKLALTLNTKMSAKRLRRLAVVEHGRVRKEMAALAEELGAVLLGRGRVRRLQRKGRNPDAVLIAAVLDALGAAHVEPGQLRDKIEATLSRLRGFVRGKELATLDDAEVLQVIWTPPHQRGPFIAGLAAPGPLDDKPGLPSFYLVQPLPQGWEPARVDSYLREYNDFMLEVLSIHEAIPGHFVQLYKGRREASKVRRVFQSGTFVEGWAVYTERVMVEAGYPGTGPSPEVPRPRGVSKGLWTVMTDPTLRAKAVALHRLKFYLRSVTNAILDHGVHAAEMTREEAIELMVSRSFQQEGEAVLKWTRAQVSSGQLSTYFVGSQQWWRLRARAEKRGAFNLTAFHDEALSHGAPPVEALPKLLGWEGGAAAAPPADAPAAETAPPPPEPPADAPAEPEAPPADASDLEDALEELGEEDEIEIE